jgi:hypothetical protein
VSAERIIEYCWWYLDHVYLILIPAAVFDVVCWIAIAMYLRKRRATRLSAVVGPGPQFRAPPSAYMGTPRDTLAPTPYGVRRGSGR